MAGPKRNYERALEQSLLGEPQPQLGNGISRPMPKEKTRMFKLLVTMKTTMPMKVEIRAATAAKAKLYASNRWPGSKSIVIK
jgi:hypothetical protein